MKRIGALAAGLLFSAPFCFDAVSETDVGWHLALGRLISQSGLPRTNALSWTAPQEPWYPTSWLYDWIVAKAMAVGGVFGLQLSNFAFLALALLGLMLAAERIDRRFGVWVTPIAGLLLISRITERPHMASWGVLTWVLFLCLPSTENRALRGPERSAATWRRRLLCLPIIALGSNLHSGAAFGAIVFGLFCLQEFLLGGRRVRDLVLGAAGGAALLLNPGGAFNVTYILQHLHVQEVVRLEEFVPPEFSRETAFFFLVPLSLLLAWRLRRELPALLVSLALFAWLGFRADRMVFEFELIATVALASGFLWLREARGPRPAFASLALILLLLVGWRLPWFGATRPAARFDETMLPVRAAEFIRTEKLDGRVFNAFTDGGYLEWALPGVPAFQDGRVQAWPPEFFAEQQAADKKPDTFRAWLVDRWGVEWALVSHRWKRMSGYQKFESPDWALVYWDETNEIFVRRNVDRLRPLVDQFEYKRFKPFGSIIAGLNTASRAELMPWLAEVERFSRTAPKFADAWIIRCGILRRLGRPEHGEICAHAATLANSQKQTDLLGLMGTIPLAPE